MMKTLNSPNMEVSSAHTTHEGAEQTAQVGARRPYAAPAVLFDEGLTVQCSVCSGGSFKIPPAGGGTCPTASS
jgi:hypothetical protein